VEQPPHEKDHGTEEQAQTLISQAYPEPLAGGEVPGLAAFTALKEGVLEGLLSCQALLRIHLEQL